MPSEHIDGIFNITKNMTNVAELFPLANNFTQGWFGFIIILIIFFGVILIFKGTKEGVLAAAVVGFVAAPILKYMGLVADWVLWASGAILVASMIIVIFSGRGGGA